MDMGSGYHGKSTPSRPEPSNNNQGYEGSDAAWANVQSPESFNPPNLGPDTTTQQIIQGGETWQGKTDKQVKQAIKERQKTQPKKETNWQNIKETINPFSRKKYYNLATMIPGSKKRITGMRAEYAKYLQSLGINPSSELLDTDNLYSFFDKQAFEKNLKPDDYGMDAPMSYGDFIAERFGAPGVKYSGNVGHLEKYVSSYEKNPDGSFKLTAKGNKIPATYGYRDKSGNAEYGQGNQPAYMSDPAYLAFLRSQQGGTGDEEVEEEVVEESDGIAGTVYPYQFYGQPDYETSATFKSYLARGGRVPAAFGGIMDTNTGRRGYFLGSIGDAIGDAVGSVAKAAGKVLKSPIGMAAAGYFLGGGGIGSFKGWGGQGFGKSPLAMSRFFQKNVAEKGMPFKAGGFDYLKAFTTLSPLLAFTDLAKAPKQKSLGMGDRGGRLINPLTKKEDTPQGIRTSLNAAIEEAGDDPNKIADINAAFPFLNLGIPVPYEKYAVAKDGGRIGYAGGGNGNPLPEDPTKPINPFAPKPTGPVLPNKMMAGGIEMDSNNEIMERIIDDLMEANPSLSIEEAIEEAKKIFDQMASRPMPRPDRVMAQEGGLMDLGGMEKDYRNEGGFVALGGEERADDVPARLSRNEFVFTADAVRGAGGGDIDKGAEIMENVMKNLEQGGKISEETQGNTGAQEMFSVSERIGEVL